MNDIWMAFEKLINPEVTPESVALTQFSEVIFFRGVNLLRGRSR